MSETTEINSILMDFNTLEFNEPTSVLKWIDAYCRAGGADDGTNRAISAELTEMGYDYAAKLDSDNADVYAKYVIGLCISSLAVDELPTMLLKTLMPTFNRLLKLEA